MSTRFESIAEFVNFLNGVPEDLFTMNNIGDDDSWDDEDDDCYNNCIRLRYYPKTHNNQIIETIKDGCCDIFITDNGRVDYKNIQTISSYGYKVYPGEYDSFGWLTGVLEFPDGRQVCWG